MCSWPRIGCTLPSARCCRARQHTPCCASRSLLLRLNQELHLARFALDDDGDVNLVADTPLARLTYPVFAEIVDWLVSYVNQMAGELGRMAQDPDYHSPLFDVAV